MKKVLTALVALALVMPGLGIAKKKHVSLIITTATTGGTYYPVGVGMATLWTTKLKSQGIRVAAQSSAGSVENIQLLENGEAELAILQAPTTYLALNGLGPFKGHPKKHFLAITALWPNVEEFVLVEKKVKTGRVPDVKGTKFVLGRSGSGTEQSTRLILSAFGINPDKDLKPVYLGYNEAANAIINGQVDGASLVGGIPIAAVTRIFATPNIKVRILEFTDEDLARIDKKYPGLWFRYIIPKGTYPGLDHDVKSAAHTNFLGVKDDLDPDLVYTLTKTLFENLPYMYKIHKAAKHIKLENALNGLPVPLHPGAYRYYKEKGLKIPARLIPPGMK